MFKNRFQYRAPEDDGGGGGGDTGNKGALDSRRSSSGKDDNAPAVKPDDARQFLADYFEPDALKGMADDAVVATHGRYKGATEKQINAALAASALKLDQRPDWLPENLYDPATKGVKLEALVKSWKDTRSEYDKLKGAQSGKVPEKPDGYAFERPKDLPAHILADPAKDESLKLLRETAHEAGLTQEQFAKMATGYYARASKLLPAPVDPKAEIAKLGANGEKVADTVITWLEGFETSGLLSGPEVDALVLQGATADGIRGLNKLREHFGGQQIPVTASTDTLPSKDELYRLVADDRYTGKNGKGDPAFRAKVSEQFQRVFGTAPAGSSEGGRV